MTGNMEKLEKRLLNLDQFRTLAEPSVWERIYGVENDSLMCCHVKTFQQTGIWVEELVPVFQKLDANRGNQIR